MLAAKAKNHTEQKSRAVDVVVSPGSATRFAFASSARPAELLTKKIHRTAKGDIGLLTRKCAVPSVDGP